ncbi:MAG: sugar phosphate isomerase/epimerase family protein, partial [Egibacteraceae bacterium]
GGGGGGGWEGGEQGAAAAGAVIAEALAAAAADLEPLGVRLAVEPKPGTAVPTALDLAAICDAGGSRNLGILVDTGHELAAGTDLDTLPGLLGERVLHVHAGDADGDDPDADLPAGRVHDLGPFLRGLAARGYRGAVTPDCYGAVSAGLCTGERATRETRDHVRAATASA